MIVYSGTPLPLMSPASGGAYVSVKTNNNYQPVVNGNGTLVCEVAGFQPVANNDRVTLDGSVTFTMDIPKATVVQVSTRVSVPSSSSNSFFVGITGGDGTSVFPDQEWHLDDVDDWTDARLPFECLPVSQGLLNITLSYRELDTAVDVMTVTNDFEGPFVALLKGCPSRFDPVANASIMACPTSGGESNVIEILGSRFCGVGMVDVMVDSRPCQVVGMLADSGCNLDVTAAGVTHDLLCRLPIGGGANKTVTVTVNGKSTSIPISFAAPTLTGLAGCALPLSAPSRALSGCSTHGGDRITLFGRDLGHPDLDVSILIGGRECADVVFPFPDDPQSAVSCLLPPGTEASAEVEVVVEGLSSGGSQVSGITLGYAQYGCNAEGCSGNGVCNSVSTQCECDSWYLGTSCDVDGRIAILIPCLAALSLICLIIVGLVLYRRKSVTYKLSSDSSLVIPDDELVLGSLLGKGSYGDVYSGTWRSAPVAIKRMRVKILKGRLLKEFVSEANMLLSLRHPNVVMFMGIQISPPSIVTELMSRGSLYSVLHNPDLFLDSSIIFKWAHQTAKGMQFLASSGVIHADFKSLNILFDAHWIPKIIDFGMSTIKEKIPPPKTSHAKRKGARASSKVHPSSGMGSSNSQDLASVSSSRYGSDKFNGLSKSTAGGGGSRSFGGSGSGQRSGGRDGDNGQGNVGTVFWAPPEVLAEGPGLLSTEGDLYSFGVTLWEFATRADPYYGANPIAVALEVIEGRRPDMEAIPPTLSVLTPIITRLLHNDPAARGSFTWLSSALAALYLDADVVYPTPATQPTGFLVVGHLGLCEMDSILLHDTARGEAIMTAFHTCVKEAARASKCSIIRFGACHSTIAAHTPARAAGFISHFKAHSGTLASNSARIGWVMAQGDLESHKDSSFGDTQVSGDVVDTIARTWTSIYGGSSPLEGVPPPSGMASLEVAASSGGAPNIRVVDVESVAHALSHGGICVHGSSLSEALGPLMPDGAVVQSLPEMDATLVSFTQRDTGGVGGGEEKEKEETAAPNLSVPSLPSGGNASLTLDPHAWVLSRGEMQEVVERASGDVTSGSCAQVYRTTIRGEMAVAKVLFRQDYDQAGLVSLACHVAAAAAAGIKHAGLVGPVALCLEPPLVGFVVPYVSDGSLGSHHRNLSGVDTLVVLKSMAESLASLHRGAGLAHGQLKPNNVLLVVDAEEDKVVDGNLCDYNLSSIRSTMATMTALPSALYMAPEQLTGLPDSPASDVYVFGTILYELVNDRPAFEGYNAMEIAFKIMNRMHPSLEGMSAELAGIIAGCWEEAPDLRPSAGDLRVMLDRVEAESI